MNRVGLFGLVLLFLLGISSLTGVFIDSHDSVSLKSIPGEVAASVARSWENARTSASITRKIRKLDDDPVKSFVVPILFGVVPGQIADSWGDPRSGGRRHEGTDIMAPQGAFIISPTEAVVTAVGYGANGGNYVYTANPGGERFYYAHLDSIPKHVKPGLSLEIGDLIGYVGNTGNAQGGASHLHLGIYAPRAINPYPRITRELTSVQKVAAFDAILATIDDHDDRMQLARTTVAAHQRVFADTSVAKLKLSKTLMRAIADSDTRSKSSVAAVDMSIGAAGEEVQWLQDFLIAQNKGVAARLLKTAGATGTFGAVTKAALAEYQASQGLPATGTYGAQTRNHIATRIR
jgi:peptidoglycan hydrolase-like protein with peptidoglycan-binding domain